MVSLKENSTWTQDLTWSRVYKLQEPSIAGVFDVSKYCHFCRIDCWLLIKAFASNFTFSTVKYFLILCKVWSFYYALLQSWLMCFSKVRSFVFISKNHKPKFARVSLKWVNFGPFHHPHQIIFQVWNNIFNIFSTTI